MKTNIELKEKKTYFPPQIELIRLDNEISLQLASAQPESVDPDGEPLWSKAEQHNNDPYKMA